MSARDAARAIAAGRVVVGAAFLVAPALAGRGWIGDDAERPGVQAIFRALGIRDLILGMLTLHVVDRPGIGARTVATCAAADAVDFRRHTRRPREPAAGRRGGRPGDGRRRRPHRRSPVTSHHGD